MFFFNLTYRKPLEEIERLLCVPGPSEHLQKRAFSRILYREIASHMEEAQTGLSAAGAFT